MRPRRLLFRHFLRQFASFEATATGGEAKHVIIAVVTLIAAPGYLAAIAAAREFRVIEFNRVGRMPLDLWLWKQEWLLLAVSLVTVVAVAAVQWRSLVLRGRDFRILGVLPVSRRNVALAKLQSLAAVVLLLHAAINTLPGIWLPIASPLGYLRAAFALQVALLAQTVFALAAVVALQGAVSLVLPARASRSAAAAFQATFLLAAALLFVAEGSISRLAFAWRDAAHPVNWLVPVVWFRALYVELLGVDSPALAAQARLAVVATVTAVAAAVPSSLLGFRDTGEERVPSAPAGRLLSSRLAAVLDAGPPLRRAIASFVRAALFRSPSALLIARGCFVMGVALCLSGLIGVALRGFGYDAPVLPARPLHAPAFVLPFFALVGFRLASAYPATLGANWIFRLTETPGSSEYLAGVRQAAWRSVVLPIFAALAVAYAALWGPLAAAAHLLLSLAVALITVEWLFLDFPKIPFTCTYQPGKANLRVTWPRHTAVFLVYCGLLPSLSARVAGHPLAWGLSVGLLLAGWRVLARWSDRRALARRLVFDDAAAAGVTILGLEWRARADRPAAARPVAGGTP